MALFGRIKFSKLYTDGTCQVDFPFPTNYGKMCCADPIRAKGCPKGRGVLEVTDPPKCCTNATECPAAYCHEPANTTG